jgi:hypothetical protein
MGTQLQWSDAKRVLTLRLAPRFPRARATPQAHRSESRRIVKNLDFNGTPRELSFYRLG